MRFSLQSMLQVGILDRLFSVLDMAISYSCGAAYLSGYELLSLLISKWGMYCIFVRFQLPNIQMHLCTVISARVP